MAWDPGGFSSEFGPGTPPPQPPAPPQDLTMVPTPIGVYNNNGLASYYAYSQTNNGPVSGNFGIGQLAAEGWDGTAYGYGGSLYFRAVGGWTPASHGTEALFFTCPVNGVAAAARAGVTAGGALWCGGTSVLPTNATDGFFGVPTMAGAPTGAAVSNYASAPMVYDTLDKQLFVYSGAAWKGVGTVTSVGMTAPAGFTVGGSPITGAGTLALGLASQTAKFVLAAPTGAAGVPSFRQLAANDLSNGVTGTTSVVLANMPVITQGLQIAPRTSGGNIQIYSNTGDVRLFGTADYAAFDATGCNLLSGAYQINGVPLAPSATTDTTNAANITSGTLPAARLPNPTSTTKGGVQSLAAVAHQFLTSINTAGVPTQAQPAVTDLSDFVGNTSWSPTVSFATPGDLNVVYSTQTAAWEKVGPFVMFYVIIVCSTFTWTTASGNLVIPMGPTMPTPTQVAWSGNIRLHTGINMPTNTTFLTVQRPSGTTWNLVGLGGTAGFANVTTANVPSGGTINLQFCGFYF